MTPFKKSLLIAGVINVLLLLFSFALPWTFLLFAGACLSECFAGLIMLCGNETRSSGQGILLAGATGLLVGASVCTAIWSYN